MFFYLFWWQQPLQIVGRTWLNLVTWTCGSWSEGQHDLYFTVQCILKTIWWMNIIIWDYESVWPKVWPQINVGHCDLYIMVQWFCLISWRLFDVLTLLFGIMSQYDPKFDLKINIGHCDLYFMVQWFCVTSWRLWYMNIIFWDYESVWLDVWPQNKCMSTWPMFHGSVILSYISKTIWCMSVYIFW